MYRLTSKFTRSIKTISKKSLTVTRRQSYNDVSLEELQRLRPNKNNHNNNNNNMIYPIVGVAVGCMVVGGVLFKNYYEDLLEQEYVNDDEHTVINYSDTHSASPIHYFTPCSSKEVENLVSFCHKNNISFRPMGSGISPNGIGFGNNGIMDMSNCNKILNIDANKKQISVEAGIRVKDVIKAIIPYNMALQNIPSIQEQQIGGLIQVGAHGTGVDIPPCDMQVVSMTIVTPNHGKLVLTPKDDLFYYARVGLGSIGVVTEVTLQCVERHKLAEYLWVMDVNELISKRDELMSSYKHLKFLWVPYTKNKVIVIAANECDDAHFEAIYNGKISEFCDALKMEVKCQESLRNLYYDKTGDNLDANLSFADLRDLLLGYNDAKHVLDTNWIKEINCAELQYWTNLGDKYKHLNEEEFPQQIDFSENVLSFACGGQQWVYEICFPVNRDNDENDHEIPLEIQFSMDVLQKIKEHDIAAPAPLEQRFTSSSSSYLSPSYSSNINDIFCWFGIIFYLPTTDKQKRRWISNEFHTYSRILDEVADKYGAVGHWAKIETHYLKKNERKKLQQRLKNRFGDKLEEFLKLRNEYDPKGILINDVVSDLFNI